ncbi:Aspartate aminotransferase [Mucinivorans hirudinis]|uniref:Aspartate aminotransferase n=1 Tax=Mucinivorans hirudinis TaxID=1433126 RepID=A0A060REQ6_9BACT|nr:Aspartate aminotransferase [Mucinivorans hirudinis]
MPQLSQLAGVLPASPIRKLVPYAEAAKRKGTKVYHLNIGQPDIETPAVSLEAIHNLPDKVLEYTHSAGIENYRRRLADFYNRRNLGVDYTNIIVTTGGSEALLFGFLAICNAGDQVIVPEPFYANYNSFAMEAGVEIVPIKSFIENGFALPAIAEFEKKITPKTRAILICNPNNPTGYLYSKEEIEQLRELVIKHDLYLLSDEVYSDFCYDGREHYSVLNLKGVDNNVIMFDSVSKRYSMCGVRAGALISRNCGVLDAVLRMGQARLCAPYIAQVAANAAIDTPQSYFDDVKKEYIARRNCVVEALQKMDGVVCPCPGGAFYAVAKLPIDNADKFAQWLLEEFEYEGETVMVAPATGFYYNPKDCPQDEIRIAYVLKIEDLQKAMKILEIALGEYNAKRG